VRRSIPHLIRPDPALKTNMSNKYRQETDRLDFTNSAKSAIGIGQTFGEIIRFILLRNLHVYQTIDPRPS